LVLSPIKEAGAALNDVLACGGVMESCWGRMEAAAAAAVGESLDVVVEGREGAGTGVMT
jgi:hypothetical protein